MLQLQLQVAEDSKILSVLAVDVLDSMLKTMHGQMVTDGAQPGTRPAWEGEFGMAVAVCHVPSRRVVIPSICLS